MDRREFLGLAGATLVLPWVLTPACAAIVGNTQQSPEIVDSQSIEDYQDSRQSVVLIGLGSAGSDTVSSLAGEVSSLEWLNTCCRSIQVGPYFQAGGTPLMQSMVLPSDETGNPGEFHRLDSILDLPDSSIAVILADEADPDLPFLLPLASRWAKSHQLATMAVLASAALPASPGADVLHPARKEHPIQCDIAIRTGREVTRFSNKAMHLRSGVTGLLSLLSPDGMVGFDFEDIRQVLACGSAHHVSGQARDGVKAVMAATADFGIQGGAEQGLIALFSMSAGKINLKTLSDGLDELHRRFNTEYIPYQLLPDPTLPSGQVRVDLWVNGVA